MPLAQQHPVKPISQPLQDEAQAEPQACTNAESLVSVALQRQLTLDTARSAWKYDPSTGLFESRANPGRIVGSVDKMGYVILRLKGVAALAHRVAWLLHFGEWPSRAIDHINGVRHDNRIVNLRDVDRAINAQNRRGSANKLALLGVHRFGNRYRAMIFAEGRTRHIGLFDSAFDAHTAYVDKKRQLHPGCTL